MQLRSGLTGRAHVMNGASDELAPLLEAIGDARFVLLGEASHGTHEFYRERARITQELIRTKGFTAVAVEADWPDAYRVNRYLQGASADGDAVEALGGFKRFPTWMWRNAEVVDFVGWLRAYNDERAASEAKVCFYGLDLYSLGASIEAVIDYLSRVDPPAAERARRHYSCFDHVGADSMEYAYSANLGLRAACRDDVVAELLALRRRGADYLSRDGIVAGDEYFYAEQNALVAANAEEYYRTMLDARVSSWNLRDRHMMESLDRLAAHLGRTRGDAKVVVWAHNSHVGDARATEMGARGELNLGQLVRERHGDAVRSIGFSTYGGTVSAASDWGAPVERKAVRPALAGSYEALFHSLELPRFALLMSGDEEVRTMCRGPLLERAIGVIYRPETERGSHYFRARLSAQFDAVIHVDHTRAVEPLERTAVWEAGEIAETYPSGV
jgi:erythromycin esterase-like protein